MYLDSIALLVVFLAASFGAQEVLRRRRVAGPVSALVLGGIMTVFFAGVHALYYPPSWESLVGSVFLVFVTMFSLWGSTPHQ